MFGHGNETKLLLGLQIDSEGVMITTGSISGYKYLVDFDDDF